MKKGMESACRCGHAKRLHRRGKSYCYKETAIFDDCVEFVPVGKGKNKKQAKEAQSYEMHKMRIGKPGV